MLKPQSIKPQVHRLPIRFEADDTRVIARHFPVGGEDRVQRVIGRVLSMPVEDVAGRLQRVVDDFGQRHRGIESVFQRHFDTIGHHHPNPKSLTREQRLLIGAYFTMEYAIESAALFNPSIVPHADQSGLAEGELRFIMSLRATGEGHVSSIVFRTGIIDAQGQPRFDPSPRYAASMKVKSDRDYEKKLFFLKLIEMGAYTEAVPSVLDQLQDTFTYEELDHACADAMRNPDPHPQLNDTAHTMRWLARSNYVLTIPEESDPAEVIIFPTSENESRGIEDARLTRFTGEDGEVTYFGTYTAYNGFNILPQIFETRDFHTIHVHTLNGRFVQNKGMALFPRKIDGLYHMISRLDGENMFIMKSDNVHFWNDAQRLCEPMYPWEFVQIGNCGAPIETEAGWLLLTHGVGPVRRYCIGACLLDLENPARVIGHLDEPLIEPNEEERDGYVPNVVYTCGAIVHADTLVIPYAVSDSATTVCTIPLKPLLERLANHSVSCPLPDRRVNQRD